MKSHFFESLHLLNAQAEDRDLTLQDVFTILGNKGDEILLIFLCLPFLQPIPLPGLSTPLGVMVVMIGILSYFDRPPWLPKKFRGRTLGKKLLLSTLTVAEKVWTQVEKILEPRWDIFFKHPFFKIFNTLVICSQGLLLCLPLPIPFSNNIPALVIVANAIGQLEEDGLVVVISYFIFAGALVFFSSIAFGLESGWDFFNNNS